MQQQHPIQRFYDDVLLVQPSNFSGRDVGTFVPTTSGRRPAKFCRPKHIFRSAMQICARFLSRQRGFATIRYIVFYLKVALLFETVFCVYRITKIILKSGRKILNKDNNSMNISIIIDFFFSKLRVVIQVFSFKE